MQIQSVCLSASQASGACTPSASICQRDGDRRVIINVEWADMSPIPTGDSAVEWVYTLLARMVENFDDHLITTITVDTVPLEGEGSNAV